MTIDGNDLMNSIMESLARIEHIQLDDIPNIDLYMDQVTTLMDTKLRATTRYPKADKILTKTMINNYAKNDLLPPPVKKKYSKEHVLMLIFIYYFKSVLSINDIQTLLQPLAEKYFKTDGDWSLAEIYEEVFRLEPSQIEALKADVTEKYQKSQEAFAEAEEEDAEFLRQFAFVCMLSYDVYIKKLMIEKIVDEMRAKKPEGKNEKHEKQDKKEQKDS